MLISLVVVSVSAFGGDSTKESAPPPSTEIIELRRKVADQELLIQQLLRRQSELERQFESLRKPPGSPARDTEIIQEDVTEQPPTIVEVDDKTKQIEERLSLIPTISGYYDFEFTKTDQPGTYSSFDQHHVSIHLDREYRDFHFFAELEFLHGAKFEAFEGELEDDSRGEVEVEQAWGEYVWTDLLTLRGGIILVPNYWNVHHYPFLTLSTRVPLMVRNVFPKRMTGIMAYGTRYWDEWGITYSAYLSNGENQSVTEEDDNERKAVGGRLIFHVPSAGFFDQCDIGFHGYADKPADGIDVRIWGLETQIRKGSFEFVSEFADRDAAEDRLGVYAQSSYRLDSHWTAFYRYDFLDTAADEIQEHTLGVNFHPIPPVALKLEGFHSNRSDTEDFKGFSTSITIGF